MAIYIAIIVFEYMEERILNFVDNIITTKKSIIKLSKEDIAYLLEETDIQMLEVIAEGTDDYCMSKIIDSFKQQRQTAIDSFQRCLLVIECNPPFLLCDEDVEMFILGFLQKEFMVKEITWGLISNPTNKYLKITIILSKYKDNGH